MAASAAARRNVAPRPLAPYRGARRDVPRDRPNCRLAFANTDLPDIMDHRDTIGEADRGVEQLLSA
jgi:hypothetical protein